MEEQLSKLKKDFIVLTRDFIDMAIELDQLKDYTFKLKEQIDEQKKN